jgi:hypothetical protein
MKPPVHRHRNTAPSSSIMSTMATTLTIALLAQNVFSIAFLQQTIRNSMPVPRATHIKRERSTIERMHEQLGAYYFNRAYRMNYFQFMGLVSLLEPHSKPRKKSGKNGTVAFSLKVSCFIRFGAGGSISDISLTHGLGDTTVTSCIWQVLSAIHKCPALDIKFPTSHAEQKQIAAGFQKKSQADFDCCVGCIDGVLVWTEQPRKKDCDAMQIGPRKFHCGRKSKFGFNMQAICDCRGVFLEVFIKHPASASDYIAFSTDPFHSKLHTPGYIADGLVLFGDNAYVSNQFMATPYKGVCGAGIKDSYNYFHSQVRINIECAFGMLSRRWGILRKPLPAVMGVKKHVLLVYALCKLHNYILKERYAERGANKPLPLLARDELNVLNDGGIRLNSIEDGIQTTRDRLHGETPSELLHGGEHFDDNGRRRPRARHDIARQKMRQYIQDSGLTRPPIICKT